ncbi:MAG: peptidase [Phycisphaerales bacterium]|nr:peptidase [Phycisphaerales bacterium]
MMNLKLLASVVMTAGLLGGCASDQDNKRPVDPNTLPAPKVSQGEARQAVQAKYPGGTVNAGKAEPWKGKLFWMFDITMAGTPNLTEVAVDQQSGKIVWTNVQTPAERAKEELEEKNEK